MKTPEEKRAYNKMNTARWRLRKQEEKKRLKEEARKARPVYSQSELGWAAGMFEGEGTVSIGSGGRKGKERGYGRCAIHLTSTDRQIVIFFQERWGGQIYQDRPAKPQHKMAWRWTLTNATGMANFIEDTQDHLRTDAEKVKFAIMLDCALDSRPGTKDPNYRVKMSAAREKMLVLNQRGVPLPSKNAVV